MTTPFSCLDLLPLAPTTPLKNLKHIQTILLWLDSILENVIQSQMAFFQDKQAHLFDPHPHEKCCHIRTVNTLLCNLGISKTTVELTYQMNYFARIQEKVNETKKLFLQPKKITSVLSLQDFVEKYEIKFVVNTIDKYIFVIHFLSIFTSNNSGKCNKNRTETIFSKMKTRNTPEKKLLHYYETKLEAFSSDVVSYVSSDIMDRRKAMDALTIAKKQAEAANRAKTEFLENIRHDIRTPLTGIIGFAELIKKEALSPHTQDYADNLVRATTALLDFQNEILGMIKLTTDSNVLIHEVFNLYTLTEKVVDLVRPKAIIKNLSLNFNYDAQLPHYVISDSKRLFRLLLELVTNALKFTAVGEINIRVSIDKIQANQLILRCDVKDTGIGIPLDKSDDIFSRFQRLSPSSDGVYEGTGLGLAVVKKIIADLKGKISLVSALKKGTTVTCLIPVVIPDMLPTVVPDNDDNQLCVAQPSILLVEDHAMTATVTKLILCELGCLVDITVDAKATLAQCQVKAYDVILMDLGLPDDNGFDLTKKIRMQEKGLNKTALIMALTAHKETEAPYFLSGMNAILQKPLLKSNAIQLLNQHLTREAIQLPIVDLSLGAKRIGKDEISAQSMLDLLLKNEEQDQKNIADALEKNQWHALRNITHTLLGGLAYCAAPRLESTCQQLHQSLHREEISHYEFYGRALLCEFMILKNR